MGKQGRAKRLPRDLDVDKDGMARESAGYPDIHTPIPLPHLLLKIHK